MTNVIDAVLKNAKLIAKAKKPITQKQFVVASLRRASYRWGARNKALIKARVERGIYRCAMCDSVARHPKKGIRVDHIHPVVPITGFDNWDGYIERMFCDEDGFQILCIQHHKEKTAAENLARKMMRLSPKHLFKKRKKRTKKLDKRKKKR